MDTLHTKYFCPGRIGFLQVLHSRQTGAPDVVIDAPPVGRSARLRRSRNADKGAPTGIARASPAQRGAGFPPPRACPTLRRVNPRPRIGITCDVRTEKRPLAFVFASYVRCVEQAGGLPLAIPPLEDASSVGQILEAVDGIVIVGGEDLDPRLYGEEPLSTHEPLPKWREEFDLALGRALLASDHPVLGVCYGCQLLAVVAGGALWQHLPAQVGETVPHSGHYPDLPRHDVQVKAGSKLHRLLGTERIVVNSAHHQAIKRLGAGLRANGLAPDGVVESFEGETDRYLYGVEWHPELLDDEPSRRLFAGLVDAARRRATVRAGTPRTAPNSGS